MWKYVVIALSLFAAIWAANGLFDGGDTTEVSIADIEGTEEPLAEYAKVNNAVVDPEQAVIIEEGRSRTLAAPIFSVDRINELRYEEFITLGRIYILQTNLADVCTDKNDYCLKAYPKSYTGKVLNGIRAVPDEVRDTMTSELGPLPMEVVIIQVNAYEEGVSSLHIMVLLVALTAMGLTVWSLQSRKEEASDEYHHIIRHSMLLMALADGYADDDELNAVIEKYQKLTGKDLSKETLRRELRDMVTTQEDICDYLHKYARDLNSLAKEDIVRSVIMIMAADGDLSQDERELLRRITQVLGVSEMATTNLFHEILSR